MSKDFIQKCWNCQHEYTDKRGECPECGAPELDEPCEHCRAPEDYCETCQAHHRADQCKRKRKGGR